jgi:class 3 adenylate cyclase
LEASGPIVDRYRVGWSSLLSGDSVRPDGHNLSVTQTPPTHFAWLGNDRIAYQVLGDGPVDLLFCPWSGGSIDLFWDWPVFADFATRLASFSRLIMFDRRGTGASDAASGDPLPSWEEWAEEARIVLDAVGSERAVVVGSNDAGPTAVLFAAIHPDRTQALVLFSTTARFLSDVDYPWGLAREDLDGAVEVLQRMWGTEDLAGFGMPDAAQDPEFRRFYARLNRLAVTGREAAAYFRWVQFADVREVLPSIRVSTLVMHREEFKWIPPEQGRYLSDRIPGARFVLVPGGDGALFAEPNDEIVQRIEKFLAEQQLPAEPERALAAILFTDIVGSTERAATLGDREWRNLLETHDVVARTLLDQHRGRLIRMTGDGLLATFDGPGRAIRCASALREALRALGLEIRAGLHTGEVELTGGDIAGIGVHIAARVLDHAKPGQLLTSGAVPMLVAGSGIEFEDGGEHELKGVPGSWRLFGVVE